MWDCFEGFAYRVVLVAAFFMVPILVVLTYILFVRILWGAE